MNIVAEAQRSALAARDALWNQYKDANLIEDTGAPSSFQYVEFIADGMNNTIDFRGDIRCLDWQRRPRILHPVGIVGCIEYNAMIDNNYGMFSAPAHGIIRISSASRTELMPGVALKFMRAAPLPSANALLMPQDVMNSPADFSMLMHTTINEPNTIKGQIGQRVIFGRRTSTPLSLSVADMCMFDAAGRKTRNDEPAMFSIEPVFNFPTVDAASFENLFIQQLSPGTVIYNVIVDGKTVGRIRTSSPMHSSNIFFFNHQIKK